MRERERKRERERNRGERERDRSYVWFTSTTDDVSTPRVVGLCCRRTAKMSKCLSKASNK